ncbi:MAG TPA: DUF983 domain-containing protein [Acetobacteraceae bacterium]|nr:DUF983 domain-containing protein [Acetobacteraceae bacterium]
MPPPWPSPPLLVAIGRGMAGRCPACGRTRLFSGYLRIVQECAVCGAPLGQVPADDGPPVFTVLIAGAIVVALLVVMESTMDLSIWTETGILVPLTLILAIVLLRPVKGATVGLMLRLEIVSPPAS